MTGPDAGPGTPERRRARVRELAATILAGAIWLGVFALAERAGIWH